MNHELTITYIYLDLLKGAQKKTIHYRFPKWWIFHWANKNHLKQTQVYIYIVIYIRIYIYISVLST